VLCNALGTPGCAPDLFAAHIWIAMISIISRRLVTKIQTR
jgi:hypothetical protein